ncbi:hypothetical protein TrVE_jg1448 [Triparma verrucosa]|uniref:ATP synthase F1 complex delta/epsilon subunit N-terminal domain-containing protein n=1 Tax=Triparma verrucosa TaxID=1606542 RepID=A0A9W7CAV5_9STRA|nr:hypothetical protein TrVE_jg1448 [Triparma verrucosa]
MFVSRLSSRASRPVVARLMSEAAAPSGNLVINFNLPHSTIYDSKEVSSVIIPGLAGEYGVTAGHSAIVSQMKAGVLQILHTDGGDAEKYFVPGGFALSHENSVTDITCPEAVPLDDLDGSAISSAFADAKKEYDSAEDGSEAKAAAQIDMEVNRAMAAALGTTIA